MKELNPYIKVTIIFISSTYVLNNLPQTIEGHVFTSVAVMEKLLTTEAHVIKSVKSYLHKVNGTKKKRQIKSFIAECEKEHATAKRDITQYISNPINAYRLIKRLTRDLNTIEELIKENAYYIRNSQMTYPSEQDMHGALWAINHLTILYGLKFPELANGTLISNVRGNNNIFIEQVSPMTASDCYELGLAAQEYREFHNAISWMIEALFKYDSCEDCPITDVDLVDFISRNYYIIGYFENSLRWREVTLKMNLTKRQQEEYTNFAEYLKKILIKQHNKQKKQFKLIENKNKKLSNSDLNLDRLCIENSNESITNNSLSCFYKTGPQPFLKLARLKVEEIYRRPDILMSPDFISDREIEQLLRLSKPLLKETGSNFFALKLSHLRTAQVATLSSKVVSRVTRRVSDFTDLSTVDRGMEVTNYGIGGFYAPHYDAHPVERNNSKRMIPGYKSATIAMYLSDVELGGATIFPFLNLTVFPRKKAALFWKNMLPCGSLDLNSLYGECPVLRGNKWVSTKWISDKHHQHHLVNQFEF